MRIIAGEKRGFILTAPKSEATRPTLSRVRESIFSILGARIIDAQIIDLFAGAGSLGLEALSRGAAQCTFVENAKPALHALRANIDKLDYISRAHIVSKNALTWAATAQLPPAPLLIIADPPYHQALSFKTLEALEKNPLVPDETTLVLQSGKRDKLPESAPTADLFRTEKYGETIVQFFTLNRQKPVR